MSNSVTRRECWGLREIERTKSRIRSKNDDAHWTTFIICYTMTPFTSLYYKELREHRTSFCIVLWLAVLVIAFCSTAETMLNHFLVLYLYLCGFYVTAIAAMSYAKEEESKASRFLRTLPVSSGTIFQAKLAWLGTVMLALLVLGFWAFCIPAILADGFILGFTKTLQLLTAENGLPTCTFMVTLCSLISWGYFISTRWPSKMFATLLTFCCTFLSWLVVGLAALKCSNIFLGYNKMNDHGVWCMLAGMVLVTLPIAVLGFWRAAVFYDMAEPESKPEPFLNSERKSGDWRVRVITWFFPRGPWRPFQALLWQAICQSRDILFLGLGMGLVFSLWQFFFSERFYAILDYGFVFSETTPLRDQLAVILGFGIIALGILIALGLGASLFAQDQERGLYRALGQRGISPRLVWWSRVLPVLVVILLPTPFIYRMLAVLQPPQSASPVTAILLVMGLWYLVPFCFGTFYAMLCRNVLASIMLTVGTFGLFCWGSMMTILILLDEFHSPNPPTLFCYTLILAAVVLFFPIASRLMTGPWLREEAWLDQSGKGRWLIPAVTLAVLAVVTWSVPIFVLVYRLIAHWLF